MTTPKTIDHQLDVRVEWTRHTVARAEGSRIAYGRRQPSAETVKTLVLWDSGPEERARRLIESLELADVDVFFRCGGEVEPATADDSLALAAAVKDLDVLVRHLVEAHGKRADDIVVLASGLSALLLAVWAHDYAPRIRAMVLAAPWFRLPSAAELTRAEGGRLVSSRAQRKMFGYTVDRLAADAAAIRVPTLLLEEQRRGVSVRPSRQDRFFERLQTPYKRRQAFATGDPLHGPDRDKAIAEVRQFIGEAFARDAARPSLLRADRYGFTQDEYEHLRTPLPALSARGIRYRLIRAGIEALGLFSPGIRLAVTKGFDSGQMLDYTYENRARGWLPFRWIDRIFLDNIGWKACRRRRELTEKMLREGIRRVTAADRPVRILDIAAGPGRYVLNILADLPDINMAALLCDNMAANLEDGRKLAADLGLTNVEFRLGDAFDEQALARIEPTPNLAVACGIYQLFDDNDLLLRSLRGLAGALRRGGYLVYTSLPWDPGLELGARSLVNRLGELAVRRRRTQEELDELVTIAGFEKVAMEIDEFGMSTVSLARIPWSE